ncbi:MAG: hypothetical protein CW335_05105, partial [Clostridiales bacterium]|nr:hypothetical protein [Clostridiales bacterium]
MKLFGNKKRPAPAEKVNTAAAAPLADEEQQEEKSKLQPRTRANFLMIGAISLFAGAVAMCFTLINQSAEVAAMPMEEPKAIDY